MQNHTESTRVNLKSNVNSCAANIHILTLNKIQIHSRSLCPHISRQEKNKKNKNTRTPHLLGRWTLRCSNFQWRWELTFPVQSTPASQWSLWLQLAFQGTELLFWARILPSHLWETIEKVNFPRWFWKGFLSLFCNSKSSLFLWQSAYKGKHSEIRDWVRMCQGLSLQKATNVHTACEEFMKHLLGWERPPGSSSPTIPQRCQVPLNHIPKFPSTPLPSDLKRKGNLPYLENTFHVV